LHEDKFWNDSRKKGFFVACNNIPLVKLFSTAWKEKRQVNGIKKKENRKNGWNNRIGRKNLIIK